MKNVLFILCLLAFIGFYGCSHVNNLEKYDLNQKTLYFDEVLTARASNVVISHESNGKSKESTQNIIGEAAAAIGQFVITAEVESKMRNAAKPDVILRSISGKVESSLIKYLRIRPTRVLNDSSDFIVTTTLEDCNLLSNPDGVYIFMKVTVLITDRNSGKEVWEYTRSQKQSLQKTVVNTANNKNSLTTLMQLAELVSISEDKLKLVIKDAAEEAGSEISETLREDIIKSKEK